MHLYIPCAFTSKINVTPKGVYLPISKVHSILAVANLLAHNNKSRFCYCGQISLQSAAVNCSFSDNLTPLVVTFILLGDVLENTSPIFQLCTKFMSYTIPTNAINYISKKKKSLKILFLKMLASLPEQIIGYS